MREDYSALMEAFVDEKLTGSEFESRFLKMFKGEQRPLDEWTYQLLDELFGYVDAFCADEILLMSLQKEHPGEHLSADQLKSKVSGLLKRLQT